MSVLCIFKCKSKCVFQLELYMEKCCIHIYKLSKSQSKSVILHRMYFHCRSLKRRQNPVSHTIQDDQIQLFLCSSYGLSINFGPIGLTSKTFSPNWAMRKPQHLWFDL